MRLTRRSITEGARKSAKGFMLFVLLCAAAGCATGSGQKPEATSQARIIRPGDASDVSYVCRFISGEMAASTDKDRAQSMPKSRVFMPTANDGPVSLTAVASGPLAAKERSFEEEIRDRLAVSIAGMKEGESRTIELTAQELPERNAEGYVISIARVRERPKETKMSLDDFKRGSGGKAPEVGQTFIMEPEFLGQVESVTDKEVVIRIKANPGDMIETPFGTGRILEEEKNYKVDINAVQGAIVRSGPFVGRIIGVDAQSITIDYRHPFGGETLICDVKVDKVLDEKPIASAKGK